MIVYEDIMDGDLLNCSANYHWIKNPVTAFYSRTYTKGNVLDGEITFRVDGARYMSEEDCHSLPAKLFTKLGTTIIIGDNDSDCV